MNTKKHFRNTLLAVTLIMTGFFGWSLAPGYQGFLFAITLVTMQGAALLHLPAMLKEAYRTDSGFGMLVYGVSIVTVIAVSVTASVATLSAAEDKYQQIRQKQVTLENAVAGYMDAGYVTKALETQKELDALPPLQVTGLRSAAVRIEQVTALPGVTVSNGFIILLALMLDSFGILLSDNSRELVVTREPEIHFSESHSETTEVVLPPEVITVIDALENGKIERLSVRQVRDFLNCSQRDAMTITRTCKQLELKV